MTLFGICPDQEEIVLVVCKECGRVVKASAFLRHCGKLLVQDFAVFAAFNSMQCDKDFRCQNIMSISRKLITAF